MRFTTAQFKKDQINLRNTFEFLQVIIKYEGILIDGFLSNKEEETTVTLWGLGKIFDCSVRLDVGTNKVPESGQMIEMKRVGDERFTSFRIMSIDDRVGTSYLLSLQSEYMG